VLFRSLSDYDRAYGIKSCCLRYFNAAGWDPEGVIPWKKRNENNLIPKVLNNVLKGKNEALIYGMDYPTVDGTCIRDYIHVSDLACAHVLALDRLLYQKTSQSYNLGSIKGYSVYEIIKTIAHVTKVEIAIKNCPRRPGDPARLVANASKAKNELGWSLNYDNPEVMIKNLWDAMCSSTL